jgi:hypothetical protein
MARISLKQLPGSPVRLVGAHSRRPVGGGKKRGHKNKKKPYKKKGGKRGGGKKRGANTLDNKKKKKLKQLLPLLKTLQGVKTSDNRSILLSHLDDEACEALYETIYNVIANDKLGPKERKKLRKALWAHQEPIHFLTKNGKKFTRKLKRKKLASMGGNPLGVILAAAIPLITNLLFKKRQ